ncbi:hypothetical protein GCM10027044_15560 [Hymenobacter ruber]
MAGLLTGRKAEVQPLFDADLAGPRPDWEADITEWWETADVPARTAIIEQIQALHLIPDAMDGLAAGALQSLLPSHIEYCPVSPQKWVHHRDAWLAEASVTRRLVCLFDKQFSYLPPGDTVPLDGLAMLEHAVQAVRAQVDGYDGRVLFGIFSHEFKVEGEQQQGAIICNERRIPSNVFLPISKWRYDKPDRLAEGIQMLVLNLYAGSMKNTVKRAMSTACRQACEELDRLDVFDFDDMVLKSSLNEGVWEGETLVRLFLLLQKRHGWEELLSATTASSFNTLVQTARQLAYPRLFGDHGSDKALEMRRLELYVEGPALNRVHAPLALGDIFEINASKRYILLAPPCDMMVRSGKEDERGRRGKPANELKWVELFRIHDIRTDQVEGMTPGQLRVSGFLQHYKKGNLGRISFKDRIIVSIQVLELAVLNGDGTCQLDLSNLPAVPSQFHPAWQARYPLLVAHFQQLVEPIRLAQAILSNKRLAPAKRSALEQLIGVQLNPNKALPRPPVFQNEKLNFHLKRSANYRHEVSQHLLAAYTDFLSRPAEEHDFSALETD